MAVLHLLLQRNADARSAPELAETIARHDPSLKDLSFDLVPLHMIGAESMEQAILGGYVEHVKRTDSGAPSPGVFADAGLFEQAELMRTAAVTAPADPRRLEDLKFSAALSPETGLELLERRDRDSGGVSAMKAEPVTAAHPVSN